MHQALQYLAYICYFALASGVALAEGSFTKVWNQDGLLGILRDLGGLIGGLLTLVAAGVAWAATRPTSDLAKIQRLLAEREVLLSTKRECDAELLSIEETKGSLDIIISQIRLSRNEFGHQSSLLWINDAENRLTEFRRHASPIFNHMNVGRARLDTGEEGLSREEAIEAIKTLEAEMVILIGEVRRAIFRQPTAREIAKFEEKVRASELTLFVAVSSIIDHRSSIEQRIARIMNVVSQREMQISGEAIGTSAPTIS